jgi:hypothetical protein
MKEAVVYTAASFFWPKPIELSMVRFEDVVHFEQSE